MVFNIYFDGNEEKLKVRPNKATCFQSILATLDEMIDSSLIRIISVKQQEHKKNNSASACEKEPPLL